MEFQEKLTQIYNGWKNLVFENPQVEEEAKRKALICAKCEKNELSICTSCGCFIPAKVRSSANCPLNKW